MPFLLPNQQRQSTEGTTHYLEIHNKLQQWSMSCIHIIHTAVLIASATGLGGLHRTTADVA